LWHSCGSGSRALPPDHNQPTDIERLRGKLKARKKQEQPVRFDCWWEARAHC
jgi:hypothetical protein